MSSRSRRASVRAGSSVDVASAAALSQPQNRFPLGPVGTRHPSYQTHGHRLFGVRVMRVFAEHGYYDYDLAVTDDDAYFGWYIRVRGVHVTLGGTIVADEEVIMRPIGFVQTQ